MEIQDKQRNQSKIAMQFIFGFVFIWTIYLCQAIIIPIVFAAIIAILMNPIVDFLMRKKIPKLISITIAVSLALGLFAALLYVLSAQISMFSETYPQLKIKVDTSTKELTHWLSQKFNISEKQITGWMYDKRNEQITNFAVQKTIADLGKLLVTAVLIPVYVFMLLYYKTLLLEFVGKLFKVENHKAVTEVLFNSKKIIQSYLLGLFFEMLIVAILNSIGLLCLGIDYAIILGITGAILNIIPYIGGVIGIALPMIIAFVTKNSISDPILVLLLYLFIQFIDNNYIVPRIVASRVKINALVSIIAVIIGGALWGVSGMFLSIPITAIMKVIFDHIEHLKPWGFLLGNTIPSTNRFSFGIRRPKKVKESIE